MTSLAHTPAFFEKCGPKEPQVLSPIPGPFAHGHPEVSYFEFMAINHLK